MPQVPYLTNREDATVARMNRLYEELDIRLRNILAGKSPLIAFNAAHLGFPADLLGKCFFFVDPGHPTKYAHRCQGAKAISGSATGAESTMRLYPYDHQLFKNAAQALANPIYDEANSIVEVDNFAAGLYGSGLSIETNVSLLDHSLEAHKYQRPSDGKTFYIKERSVGHPERHYDYAVAELILEGVTSVSIPAHYDKYCFFRIHNLNYADATVSFAGGPTVQVSALECVPVRRTRSGAAFSNYQVGGIYTGGWRYFWKFTSRDPRHYWFFQTTRVPVGFDAEVNTLDPSPYGRPVSCTPANSMVANNLSNPAILYDWIKAFAYRNDGSGYSVTRARNYAWFVIDDHEICDIKEDYCPALLADPSNGGSSLGDLVFHKGKVLLVKFHKTTKIPGYNYPDSEWQEIEFNGFSTLAADWAPYGIDVVEVANGQIEIRKSATVTDWDYFLIPFGTNLFRLPNDTPTGGVNLPFRIDPHWFDQQGEAVAMNQRAPQILPRRTITEVGNGRGWRHRDGTLRGDTGDPKLILADIGYSPNSFTTLWAPQNHTVSELLSLAFFSDKTATLNNEWTAYKDARVVLTPFGHVMLFYEEIPASVARYIENDFYSGVGGMAASITAAFGEGWELVGDVYRRKRIIKLRGHGFGYPEEGRVSTMFLSPRHPRLIQGRSAYVDEVSGPSGKDYTPRTIDHIESDIKLLRRIKKSHLGNQTKSARFWTAGQTDDGLNMIWEKKNGGATSFKVFLAQQRSFLTVPVSFLGAPNLTYSLLPEHYNGMAQAVNQCKKGKQIDARCLRFEVTWNDVASTIGLPIPTGLWTTPDGSANNADTPVPIDTFDFTVTGPGPGGFTNYPFDSAKKRFQLYRDNSIPIRTVADIDGWQEFLTKKNVDRKIEPRATVHVAGAAHNDSTDLRFRGWYADLSLEFTYSVGYPDSTRPAGTAFFANTQAFAKLEDAYSGFQYVTITDVSDWLAQFGIPFNFDERFTPLELKFLEADRTEANGRLHRLGPVFVTNARLGQQSELGLDASKINGSYPAPNLVTDHLLHPDVSILAFVPAVETAQMKWKSPIMDRSIKSQKFWLAHEPVFYLAQASARLITQGGTGQRLRAVSGFGTFSPDTGIRSAEGPFIHLIFGNRNDEDHHTWLQMNWRLLAPQAVRVVAGEEAIAGKYNLIHENFWAYRDDLFQDADARLIETVRPGIDPNPDRGGTFYHTGYDHSRSTSQSGSIIAWPTSIPSENFYDETPWRYVEAFANARLTPTLQAGLNLLPINVETETHHGSQYYVSVTAPFSLVDLT
jgi:hypothetical protein